MTVFVDASFLVALFNTDDEFHPKARDLARQLEDQGCRFVISNIVVAEAINVVFRLQGPIKAKRFYRYLEKAEIEEFFVPEIVFQEAHSLLWRQKKKGLNFFDCLHLASMKHLKIKDLLTFDQGFKDQGVDVQNGRR